MSVAITIIVILAAIVALMIWYIRIQSEKREQLADELDIRKDQLNAIRADNARLTVLLQDIKIIEDKRREDKQEILNSDDADIAGILNQLFDSPGTSGNG